MKRKWSKIILSFICGASLIFGGVGAKAEVIHETDLEKYIMGQMSSAHVTGMSISIVSADRELYCAAYGAAGKTTKDYVLGDLSKSFTAAAIMRLAEDSELRLEDPVGDYLPEYQNISDVTIQDLLHHTSGITKYEVMSDIQAKGKKGTFEYANANYNLLGKIIEAVTGTSYIEYVSDNILDPLKMESTYSLINTVGFEGEMVTGYQSYFGFPFTHENKYDKEEEWMQVPSNYLVSDVKDMGNYLRMYLSKGGDVLSKRSIKSMLNQGVSVDGDQEIENQIVKSDARYAMGWIEKEISGEKMFYHTGSVENYTATMILLPEKNLGISLLFNTSDSIAGQKLIEELEAGIIAIELGQKADNVSGSSFFIKHGVVDFLMLLLLLGAWMPIFLMGFWKKKRKDNVWNPVGIGIDVVVHLVLPTVLLLLLPQVCPVMWIQRFLPSVYYVVFAAIVSLYIGAAIKVIAMVFYALKEETEEEETEETKGTEEAEKEAATGSDDEGEKKSDKEGKSEKKSEEEKSDKPEQPEEKSEEKKSDKRDKKPEKKAAEAEQPEEKSDKPDKPEKKPEKEVAEPEQPEEKSEEEKSDKPDKKLEKKAAEPEQPEEKSEEKKSDKSEKKPEGNTGKKE